MNKFGHTAIHYVLAIVLVAIAIFIRWMLTPYVEGRLPFVFLMLALVVVSASGGVGPGLMAHVIGCLATMWLFLSPTGSFKVAGLPLQLTLVVYALVGLLIVLLGQAFKRARERSRAF